MDLVQLQPVLSHFSETAVTALSVLHALHAAGKDRFAPCDDDQRNVSHYEGGGSI